MNRSLLACVGCCLLAGLSLAQPAKETLPVVLLAPQDTTLRPALAWSLTIDPDDQIPGNAALLWLRAGAEARGVRYKWSEKEWAWAGPSGTPLDKLPRKEVKELLDKHRIALRLADDAARCTHCDWGYPPLKLQSMEPSLESVQMMRELTQLLTLRCRLELAERRFADARRTLQTNLTLARHVGQGQTLIQDLVGIALATIVFSRIEEWIQMPGSPNLYWALTDLPRSLVPIRESVRREMGTVYRSFPVLKLFKERKLTSTEAMDAMKSLGDCFKDASGTLASDWMIQKDLAVLALTVRYYPEARKALLARGRTAKDLEGMPQIQVCVLAYLEEYDQVRDDVLKWLSVPAWQGSPELEKIERAGRELASKSGNPFISLLLPAISKLSHAQKRLDRLLAGLRAAEALRDHASRTGKPPARLAEIKAMPVPVDPVSGDSMDAWYSVKEGKATLDVPPLQGMPSILGRRYEWREKQGS